MSMCLCFFFQAEDGIRDGHVTGVQTCALPIFSTGYGQSMIDRGQHELGGAPFTDIMALTDAVVARDDIDAERTAFAGGSYGGDMANWVAGHTCDRFRCIVTHASLWDTATIGSTTDNTAWDRPMREQNRRYNPQDFVA